MGALLALLALISFSTLASRVGGQLRDRATILVLPLAALGFTASPRGLGYLDASFLELLSPAIDVGAAWLALLAGLLVPTEVRLRDVPRPLFGVLLVTLVGAIVALTVFSLPVALLVGATLALLSTFALSGPAANTSTVMTEIVATLTMLLALLAMSLLHEGASTIVAVLVLAGLGVSLSLAYLVGTRGAEPETQVVALVAIVLFGAGLARTTSMPTAPLAWIIGAIIGRAGRGAQLLDAGLKDTSRPATLAVLLLSGAMLDASAVNLLLGLGLATTLGLLRVALWRRGLMGTDIHAPGLSVAFAASVSAIVPHGSAFLSTVCVAAAGLEIVSALHTFLARDRRASSAATTTSEPVTEVESG